MTDDRQTNFERVRAFHEKFQLPIADRPTVLAAATRSDGPFVGRGDLNAHYAIITRGLYATMRHIVMYRDHQKDVVLGRVQLMLEEMIEFVDAAQAGDLPKMADALADLEYFLHGTSVMMGTPSDAIFRAVHDANMRKVRVGDGGDTTRPAGLGIMKPGGWTPPDVGRIIAEQRDHPHVVQTCPTDNDQ